MAAIIINGNPIASNPPVMQLDAVGGVRITQVKFQYGNNGEVLVVRILTEVEAGVVDGVKVRR